MSQIQKRPLLVERNTSSKKCKIEQAITNIIGVNNFSTVQVPCCTPKERNINTANLISIPLMRSNTRTSKNISNTQFTVHKNLIYLTGEPNSINQKLPKDNLDLDEGDLQILLQNFYKLEGDEQQLLISHLKKLETEKPDIIDNLKRFVRVTDPEFKIPGEKDDCESDLNDLDDLDDILEDTDAIIPNFDDESIVNVINKDNSIQTVAETNIKSPVNHKKDCSDAIKPSVGIKHDIIDLTVSPEPPKIDINPVSNLETVIHITEKAKSKINNYLSPKPDIQEENLTNNVTETSKGQKIKINLLPKQEKQVVNIIEKKENIVKSNTPIIINTNKEEEKIKAVEPIQKIIVQPKTENIEPKEDKKDLENKKPIKAEIKIETSASDKKEPAISKINDKQIDVVKVEPVELDKKVQVVEKKDDKKNVQLLEEKGNKQVELKVEKKEDKQIEIKVEKKNDTQIAKKDDKPIVQNVVKKEDKETEKKDDKESGKKVDPPPIVNKTQPPPTVKKNKKKNKNAQPQVVPKPKPKKFPFKPVPNRFNSFHSRQRDMVDNNFAYNAYDCGYDERYDQEYQDYREAQIEYDNWQRNAMEEAYYHRQQERFQEYYDSERHAQHFGYRNYDEMRNYFDMSGIYSSGNFYSFSD